jgi:thiosulfate dehydrogenase
MRKMLILAVIGLLTLYCLSFIHAHELEGHQKPEGMKLGGLLYDKWYKLVDKKPEGNHPLYPPAGRKSGKTTWRCKECHGWDYIGRDGSYGKGPHYTGIKGIYGAKDKSREEIYKALTDKAGRHDFSPYLKAQEIEALVEFIKNGLIDLRKIINQDGSVKGDPERGKELYNANCAVCHGVDGKNIDFKSKKEGIQGVGWLARENPQETLHKIRWGHPGSPMPSMIVDKGLSDKDTIDILSYCQRL